MAKNGSFDRQDEDLESAFFKETIRERTGILYKSILLLKLHSVNKLSLAKHMHQNRMYFEARPLCPGPCAISVHQIQEVANFKMCLLLCTRTKISHMSSFEC